MRKILEKYWGEILVLILSWWAIQPLFRAGFFSIHDETQVVRIHQMAQALRDLQFPVRWVADLGYGFGYPLFNFYAPLPYYVGAFFNLVGLDVLWATKMMFILGILLSGLFMYFLAREFWGELGGILAGIFYVYAPYHALDIYVRGAIGEFWAIAFLPLTILGFYKVATEPRWRWVVVGTLGLAGVILSHNLTAMMATPFLVIGLLGYWVIRLLGKERNWKTKLYPIPYTLYPLFLGLGLSAFYWLPALWEMKFTDVSSQISGGANFRDHFVCLFQLWNSPWGFGGSAPGCTTDGLSFKVGKLHLILTFFAAILFFLSLRWSRILCSHDSNHSIKERKWILGVTFGFFLLAAFMATEYSKSMWEWIPSMAYIQYPWRFLIFVSLTTAFLAGLIIVASQSRFFKIALFSILILLLLFYHAKYFQPQKYLNVKAEDYLTEENIKWKTSKISDEFLPKGFPKPQNPSAVVGEKIVALDKFSQISNLKIKSNSYTFDVSGENENLILARVAFFPGWKVFVDGKEKLFIVQNGQMFFATPKGSHHVEVVFQNTPARILGNTLSLFSLIILVGGILYERRKVKS